MMNHVCNTCAILKQQLAAANARVAVLQTKVESANSEVLHIDACNIDLRRRLEQAEAQCAAMRNCHNCKNYDMEWDNDGDWIQRCKHNDTKHDACGELTMWEAAGNG